MDAYVKSVIVNFLATTMEMAPYLLFGFLVAGLLSVFVSAAAVERHLGGRGLWPVVKASLFGVPLPLCSCSVIPVTMSLRKHGASRGSAISFLLSTPQTGVDSIFVTFSLLGPVFAILRPIVAFVTGVIGGVCVNVVAHGDSAENAAPARCIDECCNGAHKRGRIVRALRYAFVTLPQDIGGAMLVGLLIAAFITALVPDDFFAEHLGRGVVPMLVMMALGIPVYVCATASVPIAAAMMTKGLSPGAAIVFLMTGPATNAASFVTIWNQLGRRTAITYLITVAVCALAAGILLDFVTRGVPSKEILHCTWTLPAAVKIASTVVLLTVLGVAVIRKRRKPEPCPI